MADEKDLLAVIDAAEANAYGQDTSDLARERELAIRAYAGENIEPAPKGRSQVVDWTVFETIQWILPSLIRIFANGDNVVEFAPTGPEDEESAEQESDYLNYLVTQKNNWFLILLTWFQDALLTKNAYCMAFIEEQTKTESTWYRGQSEQAVALLLQDKVEVVEQDSYPDPDDTEKLIDPTSGQVIPPDMAEAAMLAFREAGIEPIIQPPRTLFDVKVRRTEPLKRLQFRVLPPERCKISEETPDFTMEQCDYFEYFEFVTISDLRAQGWDVADDIAADPESDRLEEGARDRYFEDFGSSDMPDPSLRRVKARTIWIRYDFDEDGIAELQKVVRVGSEILSTTDGEPSREEVSRIPVASIVPFLNTHRHIGTSVADATFDLQRIKTVLLRGGLDSLYQSQNNRHVVSDKVVLDDMLINRPGANVRLKAGALPSEGHVLPLTTEFVLPQSLEGLRHMDTVVESRVGVNRIFQGIDESSLNDHNRIGQLSTMAAQRVEQIARVFANGVEYLFSLAHELIIKSGHSAETIKLRGKWVQIDPSEWRTGRDMRMVAPFAAGNKDALLQRLSVLAGFQEKALAAQLPIVDAQNAYNTMIELTKAADMPAPEKFWTDPSTVPPPEPPPDHTMMALEIENKKADNAAQDSQTDAQVAMHKANLDAELKKYTADLNAEVQLIIEQLKAGENINLEGVKAQLQAIRDDANAEPIRVENESIQQTGNAVSALSEQVAQSIAEMAEAISEIQDAQNAEREVVRDENGKITGVRINGRVREVQRDENGTIVGV